MSGGLPVVAEKAHATLGASSAARWMACPGSVRLSRGIPDVETDFAREGTAAHALAELALRRGARPEMWVGLSVEGVEVTEEMAEYVSVFVDHCRDEIATSGDAYWIERKFSLAAFNPPEPMFGTADFVIYNPTSKELTVIDLKYGAGVVVEATGNKQLRYYALGAALSLEDACEIRTVRMEIVQPRAAHADGVVRGETITVDELLGFAGELLEAARATLDPQAPLAAGAHCRFCRASARCPARLAQAQAVAQVEFADLPLDVPPAPESLPVEMFADMLSKVGILEDWIKAMYAHAQARLERGEPVPGFKLVPKRATRRWTSEEQTRQWLEGRGFDPDEITESKLKSPAQIEKVMGKQKKELPAEFVTKQSSGYTMAPEHDPRPAVAMSAGDDFLALPAGE